MEERGGKKFRSESEWRELLERWKASGENGVSFCHREGLCVSLFHKWRRKLSESAAESSGFVEIRSANRMSELGCEIICANGRRVRVSGVSLVEIVRVVESA